MIWFRRESVTPYPVIRPRTGASDASIPYAVAPIRPISTAPSPPIRLASRRPRRSRAALPCETLARMAPSRPDFSSTPVLSPSVTSKTFERPRPRTAITGANI